ncbi:MAG: hypothetical protein LBC97_03905 [Bifidobacteriaceae bacterium]|jgi:hypothetical protein|nr:hypothetical protein [Bifidobacteriaceae bacterium]
MKNGAIFFKTLPFVFFRLLASLTLVSALTAYAALVLLGVGLLVGSGAAPWIYLIILLVFGGFGIGIYRFLSRYIAYMIKAAHVAVIAELAEHGRISSNDGLISYGAGKVRQRFASANVFFMLDALVAGAVKQIQNGISAVAGWLSAVPGAKQVASILKLFVGIVLNYVDEAVLSHIFRSNDHNAWKGAADGIVLYFQNWKAVIKNAAWIVVFLLIWYFGAGVGLFFAFSLVFKALIPTTQIAVFVSIVAAVAVVLLVKAAIIDPLILISIINNYTKVTAGQPPAIDIYEKARKFSSKFRKIEQNSGQRGPATRTTAAAGTVAAAGPVAASSIAVDSGSGAAGGAVAVQASGPPPAQPDGLGGVAAHVGTTLRRTRFRPMVRLSDPVGTILHTVRTDLVNQGLDHLDRTITESSKRRREEQGQQQQAQTQAPEPQSAQQPEQQAQQPAYPPAQQDLYQPPYPQPGYQPEQQAPYPPAQQDPYQQQPPYPQPPDQAGYQDGSQGGER